MECLCCKHIPYCFYFIGTTNEILFFYQMKIQMKIRFYLEIFRLGYLIDH